MDLFEFSETQFRSSDPETSRAAAVALESRLSGLRAKFVEGVKRCGGSATAKEAAVAMTRNPEMVESIRKRARECLDRGAVKVIGQRGCRVSGNVSQVYEVV